MNLFDAAAYIAFFSQAANYTWFGYIRRRGLPVSNLHATVATIALICFSITEGIIAQERPTMWLYVSLNVYGIFHLWYGIGRQRYEDVHTARTG